MSLTEQIQGDVDEAISAIDMLAGNKEALQDLNRYVVQMIRDADRKEGAEKLAEFYVGQRVYFLGSRKHPGSKTGTIDRINPKSVGIKVDNAGHWRVHHSFIKALKPENDPKSSEFVRSTSLILRVAGR
jgi:hypothetical protein